MTEKRYTYSELSNYQYSVDYTTFEEIYGEENIFYNRICEVSNKKQAQKVVDLLNDLDFKVIHEQEVSKALRDVVREQDTRILELEKENHILNAKVNRLTDELANCYEKLGW